MSSAVMIGANPNLATLMAARADPLTNLVLRTLLAEPTQEMYGLQICTVARLPSGTIHPILARLEGLGWLESRWEDADTALAEGRPRRRYYRLSEDRAERARIAMVQATTPVTGIPGLRPRTAGGTA